MLKTSSLAALLAGALFVAGSIAEANAFTRSGTFTGPRGKQTTYGGSTKCTQGAGCASQSGGKGPNGRTWGRNATYGR